MTPASSGPTMVRYRVHPSLSGLVVGLVGLREHATTPVVRHQAAGSVMPLVFSFAAPLDVLAIDGGQGAGRSYDSFLAGFMTGRATTRFAGTYACVQVYLTPLGVFRLLGIPGSELSDRVTDLRELLPAINHRVPQQLSAAHSWEDRFAIVEGLLLERAAAGHQIDDAVGWMWRTIVATGGRAQIRDLVAATGWSHRHIAGKFTEQIGIGPKVAASVVRFERASADLGTRPLAEVAHRHGYSDQSHLSREVLRYAGETPSVHASAARPTAYTALGVHPHEVSASP